MADDAIVAPGQRGAVIQAYEKSKGAHLDSLSGIDRNAVSSAEAGQKLKRT
jgi:hypothetical protein